MPPLLADFTHARPCIPFCEKYLTLPFDVLHKWRADFLLKKFPFYYTKRPPRFYLDDPLCNVIVSNLIRIAGPEKPYFPVFLFYMVLMDIRDTN